MDLCTLLAVALDPPLATSHLQKSSISVDFSTKGEPDLCNMLAYSSSKGTVPLIDMRGDGLRVATGSYNDLFRVLAVFPGSDEATRLEASKSPKRRRNMQASSKPSRSLTSLTRVRTRRGAYDLQQHQLGKLEHGSSSQLMDQKPKISDPSPSHPKTTSGIPDHRENNASHSHTTPGSQMLKSMMPSSCLMGE
ncbi:hypothetical protein KI387_001192, partial [Taxus chinensis]